MRACSAGPPPENPGRVVSYAAPAGGYNADMPKNAEARAVAPLPATLARSPKKARDTYEKTLESAEQEYRGDQVRAHRVAWGAVKNRFEKAGDRWLPKAEPGPSDPRSVQPHAAKVAGVGETFGGVDANGHTKAELRARARELGVDVTTRMTKNDLARAIAKKQR
jgi:cation transport regulator ChaB